MLAAYLGALAFGVVLIGASIVFGGKDLEADADGDVEFDKDFEFDKDVEFDKDIGFDKDLDFDVDPDTDIDVEADGDADVEVDKDLSVGHGSEIGGAAEFLVFNPLLSLRFWTYAMASFGAAGAILYALDLPTMLHVVPASVMGVGLGYGAAAAFRFFKKKTVSSETRSTSLVGDDAVAVLDIRSDKPGKIRAVMGGSQVELMAETQGKPIARGETVLVVAMTGHTAQVARMPQLDDVSPEEAERLRKQLVARSRSKQSGG